MPGNKQLEAFGWLGAKYYDLFKSDFKLAFNRILYNVILSLIKLNLKD